MKEIRAEHANYIYFTEADGLPQMRVMGLQVKGFIPLPQKYGTSGADTRFVLVKSPFRSEVGEVAYFYYLHWNDGTDLTVLDQKVEERTFTDADFEDAVLTTYQRTRCMYCHHEWHTLHMHIDHYLVLGSPRLPEQGNIRLFEVKYARRASTFKRCPNCGASLRQMVVKIFGEASESNPESFVNMTS